LEAIFYRFQPALSIAEIGQRLVYLGDVACRCNNVDSRREVLDYMLDIAKVAVSPLKKVYDSTKPSEEVELRIRGLENIYEELKLGKFINITEWNSENKETKL
jgi:hypothetical protein